MIIGKYCLNPLGLLMNFQLVDVRKTGQIAENCGSKAHNCAPLKGVAVRQGFVKNMGDGPLRYSNFNRNMMTMMTSQEIFGGLYFETNTFDNS